MVDCCQVRPSGDANIIGLLEKSRGRMPASDAS